MPDIRPFYQLVKFGMVYPGVHLFYRKIEVKGFDKIPRDKPILVVPNHQNSFMDALLVTTSYKPTMFYLTRAQAFKQKIIGAILTALNMLPVYRVRDGFSSVQKNKAIFEKCLEYLANGNVILVFAEANHDLKRRVRPFSKGFTRIAFDAELRHNWEFDLQILPVGLNYSDHRFSRNKVSVVYGDPIPVAKFKEAFEADERKAANLLKNATSDGLKPLVMHVPKLDQYPLHQVLLDELEPNRDDLVHPDLMNKRVELVAASSNEELIEKSEKLIEIAREENLSIREAAKIRKTRWWKLPLLPVYIFSLINNALPYLSIRHVIHNIIEDRGFDASIKLLMGLIVFPAFYFLVSVVLLISGVSWFYVLAYFLFSLVSGSFFKTARDFFKYQAHRIRIRKFMKANPEKYKLFNSLIYEFKALRNRILSTE